jgi:hypothetical protein
VAVGSHRLVGRNEEVDSLVRLLDAPDELPVAAAIVGEAGIGKTALWLAAVEEAAARGYLVLSCRPSEVEVRFSFSGLADLLGGLVAEVLPDLPPPQRRALELALALSDSGNPVEERLVAFAFLNALRRLAERNPLLLAVDDVQWLDASSLALLRYVLPRFESEPVAAVLTARGELLTWLRRDVAASGCSSSTSTWVRSTRSWRRPATRAVLWILAVPVSSMLGVAIGAQAEGAVRSHARRALAENMTPDEVRHVGLLALTTIGFPHTGGRAGVDRRGDREQRLRHRGWGRVPRPVQEGRSPAS